MKDNARVEKVCGKLLRQQAAADYLGISLKAFRNEVVAGNIEFVPVGQRRFFERDDLDAWIRARKTRCQSKKGKGRLTGGSTSRSQVIGFEEAVKLRPALTKMASPKG